MATTQSRDLKTAETGKPQQQSKLGSPSSFFRGFPSFPLVIASILIAKAVWTCRDRAVDTDLWWHLRNARWMFEHHSLPLSDTYTFTMNGANWIDHSWLSELILLGAYNTFGFRGIFIAFLLAVSVLSLGMFAACLNETDDALAAGLVSIFCGLLAMVAYTARPQLFGWICFLCIYGVLRQFRNTRTAPLWLIPILFCIWVNCHPGWLFGFAIFAIMLGAGFVRRDIGPLESSPWSRDETRKLALTFGFSLLALFINPGGFRLLLYPFDLAFRQKHTSGLIEEWSSVNFNDQRGIYVLCLLAMIFLMALFGRRRWRIEDVAMVMFVMSAGLSHIRLLLPAGVVLAPILATQFPRMSSYVPGQERRILNSFFIGLLIVFIAFSFPSEKKLRAEVDDYFPVSAVDYLQSASSNGKLFNWYEWGGYLEWERPRTRVFIDGRADFFEPQGVLADYLKIVGLDKSQEGLDAYQISTVLIPVRTPLAYFLSKSSDWRLAYSDQRSLIFQRR